MKRFWLVIFSVIFALILCTCTYAAKDQVTDKEKLEKYQEAQKYARLTIQRTGKVILMAQKAAVKGQKPAGLAKAVAHHKLAIKQYIVGAYMKAIQQSLYARKLAMIVIKRNGVDKTIFTISTANFDPG